MEKQTPNYLSVFSNFVKQSERQNSNPVSAPKPKLYTKGPKLPVAGSPFSPSSRTNHEQTPPSTSTNIIKITPGIEDRVSKEIESKIILEKVQLQQVPRAIPKNTVTYQTVSKLIQKPDVTKHLYQNVSRHKIYEAVTPSNAISVSNSTVNTATNQASHRSQQIQRIQQISHIKIRKIENPAPHTNILQQYYADQTTMCGKNGKVLAVVDSMVHAPAKVVFLGQKPVFS